MSEVTVGSLANVLGMPVEKLLEQLAGAGMTFSGPDQVVSSTEKMKLLGFLRRTHGKDDKQMFAARLSCLTYWLYACRLVTSSAFGLITSWFNSGGVSLKND